MENGKISKTALFIDLLGIMQQAGCYPLPPPTGHYFVYPGYVNNPVNTDNPIKSALNLNLDLAFTTDCNLRMPPRRKKLKHFGSLMR